MRALLTGLILASGCLAEPPAGQPPTAILQSRGARETFDRDVFPTLIIACTSCHVASSAAQTTLGFLSADATTTYERIVADHELTGDFVPANARILHLPRGHEGLRYSEIQIAAITAWLEEEASERRPQR
jgi:hypothetical protein